MTIRHRIAWSWHRGAGRFCRDPLQPQLVAIRWAELQLQRVAATILALQAIALAALFTTDPAWWSTDSAVDIVGRLIGGPRARRSLILMAIARRYTIPVGHRKQA